MDEYQYARQAMGWGERSFHYAMIITFCGLWWPVYAARKRAYRNYDRRVRV